MNRDEVLCSCFRVTAGDVMDAIEEGATTLEDIQDKTGLGTACGVCLDEYEDTIQDMLNNK